MSQRVSHGGVLVVSLALAVTFGIAQPARADQSSPTDEKAQTAKSFEQLALLVKPGDRVNIVDTQGTGGYARVVELTPSSLRVTVDGLARSLSEHDVVTISQRRSDPVGDGAKKGAIFGAIVSVFPVAAICAKDSGVCGLAVFAGGFYTAMWAGFGVGIDALQVDNQVVYRRPSSPSTLRISPIAARSEKGVRFSFSF